MVDRILENQTLDILKRDVHPSQQLFNPLCDPTQMTQTCDVAGLGRMTGGRWGAGANVQGLGGYGDVLGRGYPAGGPVTGPYDIGFGQGMGMNPIANRQMQMQTMY
ncbi:hypothetical protein HDV02_002448 [Globomyces sp. JEL0801]|nr:hypothetical protein HDV02_002448 [Globomyces sp. JEL0801]